MRILYLVHRTPYPPNRGDRIRSYNILKFLSQRADVYLACLSDEQESPETLGELRRLCTQVTVSRLGSGRWFRGCRSLAFGRSATEGMFASPELAHTIRRWADVVEFDAAFVFCSSMVQYLKVSGLAEVPTVVDLVDVDSEKWFNYSEHSRGIRRLLYRLEGNRLRSLEASLPLLARAVTLVSEEESRVYRRFVSAEKVYAVPNGVDSRYFDCPSTSSTPAGSNLVFVGVLDYRPNVDGLNWFCREVWPELHRKFPASRFQIVGRRPTASVRNLACIAGVDVVGEVADVRPYIRESAVTVAPLRIARGVQNKVLEALALASAVVASPQALEGIAADPNKHLCCASEASEWIESISALLTNPTLRQELGENGRQFVLDHHCWEECLSPLHELLFANDARRSEERNCPPILVSADCKN